MVKQTVWLAAVCLLFASTGCGSYRPARVGRGGDQEAFSLKGTGCELGRGAANIAFCWLEVPHEIEARVREDRSGRPFSVISGVFSALLGTIDGTIWAAERAIGGAFEIVLSPFPPYEPIMEPAYPPYLNFGKKKGAEKE
jgi:putative exosortase-associated protein (TIGR04073 family)